jgi:hypothetical protein
MQYPEYERADGSETLQEALRPGNDNFKVDELPEELWGRGLYMVSLPDGSQMVVEPFDAIYRLQQLTPGTSLDDVKDALLASEQELKATSDDRQSVENLINGITAAKHSSEDHSYFVELLSE